MGKLLFILLAGLSFLGARQAHADEAVTLQLPPASLAKWYKPTNERQIWLHTMFALRRSMQAVTEYAALEDQPRLEKWARRFAEDYRRIATMVPEWTDEVELEWAERLVTAAAKGNASEVNTALHRLGTSCRSCHRQYRSIAAALYRAPDFHQVKVEYSDTLDEVPYHDAMEDLSRAVNRIRIAMEDGRYETARTTVGTLRARLEDLGNNCSACHSDETARERILGASTGKTLDALARVVEGKQAREAGRLLGEIGVDVCSRCHGVHRTLSDLRGELTRHEH